MIITCHWHVIQNQHPGGDCNVPYQGIRRCLREDRAVMSYQVGNLSATKCVPSEVVAETHGLAWRCPFSMQIKPPIDVVPEPQHLVRRIDLSSSRRLTLELPPLETGEKLLYRIPAYRRILRAYETCHQRFGQY